MKNQRVREWKEEADLTNSCKSVLKYTTSIKWRIAWEKDFNQVREPSRRRATDTKTCNQGIGRKSTDQTIQLVGCFLLLLVAP